MLHPIIKWAWRAFMTLISFLMMLAGMQANVRSDVVVILVTIVFWVILMLMPNLYDKIYAWVSVEDGKLRSRRVFILSPFGFLAVVLLLTQFFNLALSLSVVIAVLVIGLFISTNLPSSR